MDIGTLISNMTKLWPLFISMMFSSPSSKVGAGGTAGNQCIADRQVFASEWPDWPSSGLMPVARGSCSAKTVIGNICVIGQESAG